MFSRESKIILAITGLSHFAVHSSMLILPVIFSKLRNEFGVQLDTLGLIAALSSFMFGLGAIPAGWIENKLGGKRLLIIYQLGLAISGFMALFSKTLTQLTLALMLLGIFASIYHPAGLTLISRRIRQTSRAMGYHGIAGSAGLASGPLLASWFAANYSWRMAYGSIAIFAIFLSLITMILIPSKKRKSGEEEDVARTQVTKIQPLVVYYIIAVLAGFAFSGFTTYMPTHFSQNSGGMLKSMDSVIRGGLFTTFVFFAGIVGQLIGGKLGDTFNRPGLLRWIILGNVPFLIAMGYTQDVPLLFFAILLGVIHFSFQPIGNSIIAQFTKSTSRGLGYGISFFLSFGLGSPAAAFGGIIAVHYGVSLVFPAMGLIMIVAFLLALYLKRIS